MNRATLNWETIGTRLAQLGGADPRLLPKAESAKGKFIQMGLVLLSTALLAVLSMSFALVDALRAPWAVAVLIGLGWGFVILNLDRLLIQNLRVSGGFWQAVLMLLPRLAVAALLGLVIATPLVVRVFQTEIVANMTEENAKSANELGATREESPVAKRLAEVNAKIATNEGIMAGNVPGLTSPNIDLARQQLATAEAAVAAKNKVAQDAYNVMICERDGTRCQNTSGKPGKGDRYDALKRLYDVAAADYAAAQSARDKAQKAVDDALDEATSANAATLDQAQQRASSELPALYAERTDLQAKVAAVSATDSDVTAANTGMLARIEALHRIGEESSSAKWAHYAVAALLFMIELLPVLVKLLTSIGPPTLYDRISKLDDDSTIDEATRRRAEDRRRIERESKKQREIDEDMQEREKKLGVRGNAHVEKEMEKILDAALARWSSQVQSHLQRQGHQANGAGHPTNGAGHPGGQVPPQPARPGGVSPTPYNLPPTGKL